MVTPTKGSNDSLIREFLICKRQGVLTKGKKLTKGLKLADNMVYAPNASHAKMYNRVTTELYLSQKREGKISIKPKGK